MRLGSPVGACLADGSPLDLGILNDAFRCPVQILGLDHDERVYAPFGEDPFVALQYAIDLIGDLLKNGSDRLHLENRNPFSPSTQNNWIWRYPA